MRRPAVLALLTAASICCAQATTFFVSPEGSDAWSGTLKAANADRTDGPFATIARGQQAARIALQTLRGDQQAVIVYLRGGTYLLDEPLQFTPEDTAAGDIPVTYAAYEDETPVISGGRPIEGWRITEEGHWEAHLPDVKAGEWTFSQFFVNDQRRYRPRLPKQGYYYITGQASPTAASEGKGYDRFRFREGDLLPEWAGSKDIEVLPFHWWSMSRLRIAQVATDPHVVTFAGHTYRSTRWARLPVGHRYLIENVPGALAEPGEWYLNRSTGVLTYIPREGEEPDAAAAIAPRLPYLVRIKGEPEAGLPVGPITFRGLTFAHTNWNVPDRGYSFSQAEANIPAAFQIAGAHHIVLERCRIEQVGGYAIDLSGGSRRCRIEDCALTDLGGGGIRMGSQGHTRDPERVCRGNVVRNCLIAHGGRLHPAAVGVLILHASHNDISHNEIHDFYYTGISVGWQWAYAPSDAHHNTIEYNHIHTIGQGVLSDMGGIYTLGPSPGTVIRCNVFHDIESYSYGGRGIYFDQATTGILAENNLVYGVKGGAFCMHFGKDNRVVNNIFALARQGVIEPVRDEQHHQFDFERNIVYWEEGPLFTAKATGACYSMKRNLYWNPHPDQIAFGKQTFAQWQASGQDEGSLIADPLFIDPANADFTLQAGSPAEEIGFEPFEPREAGREAGATQWPERPGVPRAFPPPPPERPNIPLIEDLEVTQVGGRVPGFHTAEDPDIKLATARVTDETAASGKHSLKFTDLPGQAHNYNPHAYYATSFASGMVAGSFDLRIEEGIQFCHEWRTYGHPYINGPSLRVIEGVLHAEGEPLTTIPIGEWVHIEVTCGVGEDATGEYTLSVSFPGEEPQQWTSLQCDPAFDRLSWFGFIAEGTQAGVFYLDNIRLGPHKGSD